MCTLTYYPSNNGVIITANRDESPLRISKSLSPYKTNTSEYLIAAEPKYGGTNMAVGKNGKIVVLLNGAFGPHEMKPYPGMSRGLLVLKSLEFESIFDFLKSMDLSGIEPFTLIDFMKSPVELRWDGVETHVKSFDGRQPLLWASAQLYTPTAILNRQKWFESLLKNGPPNREALWSFHHNAGNGDEANDMLMNRSNLVRTVSITQVEKRDTLGDIWHHNLIDGSNEVFSLESKP